MNLRIQQFLSAENISQAQFADTIGVARASVSHIIAGRNKPGFDFIQNMALHYPNLSLDWLISGKGRMYKDGSPAPERDPQFTEGQLFGILPETSRAPESPIEAASTTIDTDKDPIHVRPANKVDSPKATLQLSGRKITRIVVFYDDNTYQELKEA